MHLVGFRIGFASGDHLRRLCCLSLPDHLPLYRQAQIYARQGIDLDRSTLADGSEPP
jgi:hypothetical protein